MPHCIIEYASKLQSQIDVESLMDKVTEGSLKSALFELKDIKTRAIAYDYYQSAGQTDNADFIHIEVKLLAGRNMLQRKLLSKSILDSVLQLPLSKVSVTVEINDLDTECYAKQLLD